MGSALAAEIKARMFAAMKAGRTVEKEILRVALGEITTEQARGGDDGDPLVVAVLRKLVKSNGESLRLCESGAQQAVLREEIQILEAFLPRSMALDDIVVALAPVTDAIRAARNDGQATGVAMKHLAGAGAAVEGKDVAAAVKRLRA